MLNHRENNSDVATRGEAVVRYWGRKSHDLAELYIQRYTKMNQVVADIFGGSGIFVKSALNLGRRAIYVDLNPFAHLIAKTTIVPCDLNKFMRASKIILSNATVQFKKSSTLECKRAKLFSIRCKCGKPIEISSIVYSRKYSKIHQGRTSLKGQRLAVYRSIASRNGITHDDLISIHPELTTQVLSLIVNGLVKRKFIREMEFPTQVRFASHCISCDRNNLLLQGNVKWLIDGRIKSAYWQPDDKLNYKDGTRFLKRRDVTRISELFTPRNLTALTSIWHDIQRLRVEGNVKNCLRLAFMATLVRSSKMCREGGGTWPINSYWIPRTYVVRNPYIVFKNAIAQITRMLRKQSHIRAGSPRDVIQRNADVSFLVADSTRLHIPKNSVDYFIVDPPHTDEAQFFELSLFYTAWLNRKLDFNKELIINRKQGKDIDTYLDMLKMASYRVYDSLKRNGHYTIILNGDNKNVLDSCVDIIGDVGFKFMKEDTFDGYTIYTFKK